MRSYFIIILLVLTLLFSASCEPIGKAVGVAKAPGAVKTQCSDGTDNDKDGRCDFSGCSAGRGKIKTLLQADPDCDSSSDQTESCVAAPEICDGKDNDCDGSIDEGSICTVPYYCDTDRDGYIGKDVDGTCYAFGCQPSGCTAVIGNDCNDANTLISPGVTENCDHDGIDNNCNGIIDECVSCTNSIKDGTETDIDCGGTTCNPCPSGKRCIKNTDCAGITCTNGVCVDPQDCKELFPGTNIANADRVNVVFIGLSYTDINTFITDAKKAADLNNEYSTIGLLDLAIYNNHKNKFNFWYVNQIFSPVGDPATSCTYCSNSLANNFCTGLSNTYRANFCKTSFRSCANFGGNSYTSATASNWPYSFDHEFQHQFPRLADEYAEAGKSDSPRSPNCAGDSTTATQWWGNRVGQVGIDGQTVGYYDGCSYVTGNYRATYASIMRSQSEYRFGLISEQYVDNLLKTFSGSTTSSTLGNVVEVTLSGDPTDVTSYTISSIESKKRTTPEHEDKQKPYKLKIQAGDKTYTQGFDVNEYLIIEDLGSGKEIKGDFQAQPQKTIKVIVPIQDAVYDPTTKTINLPQQAKVPFSVILDNGNGQTKKLFSS